jgi:hypothetical protein
MNTPGKWLGRGGALLVLLGFVLPVMTVSCGGLADYGQSFSLMSLASYADEALLYGAPLGMLAALVFSFLPAFNASQALQYLIAQAGGIVVSVLSLLIAILTFYNQVSQFGVLDITPEFGAFFLIAGYILALVGLVLQWMEKPPNVPVRNTQEQYQYQSGAYPPGNAYAPTMQVPAPAVPAFAEAAYSGPHLEVKRGNLSLSIIPLTKDDFALGRGSQNDMQIPDPKVSRQHMRLRYAQGYWFLQDQDSSTGSFVNGAAVQATRLNPGDEITIGDTSFIFRA